MVWKKLRWKKGKGQDARTRDYTELQEPHGTARSHSSGNYVAEALEEDQSDTYKVPTLNDGPLPSPSVIQHQKSGGWVQELEDSEGIPTKLGAGLILESRDHPNIKPVQNPSDIVHSPFDNPRNPFESSNSGYAFELGESRSKSRTSSKAYELDSRRGLPSPDAIVGLFQRKCSGATESIHDFGSNDSSPTRGDTGGLYELESRVEPSLKHESQARRELPSSDPTAGLLARRSSRETSFDNHDHALGTPAVLRDAGSQHPLLAADGLLTNPFLQPNYENAGDQSTRSKSSGNPSKIGRIPRKLSSIRFKSYKTSLRVMSTGRRQDLQPRDERLSSHSGRSSLPSVHDREPYSERDLGSDYSSYSNVLVSADKRSHLDMKTSTTSLHRRTSAISLGYRDSYMSRDDRNSVVSSLDDTYSLADSTAELIRASDPEQGFPVVLDNRLVAPGAETSGYGYKMYLAEKEDDDDMHMPHHNDDNIWNGKWREYFVRDNIISTVGGLLMLLGLLMVIVGLPVLSSTTHHPYDTPLDQMPGYSKPDLPGWAQVNNKQYPLLKNVRHGLIDKDTPQSALKKTATDGGIMKLVFSDEFNNNNRTFYPGDDPFFFAPDFWYRPAQDLEWYDPDAVTTFEGTLQLRLDKHENHNLHFRSGMLNSWNQLCMKGGRLEVSVSLAGPAGISGLWPGVWSMGNLGRPGYGASKDGVWPYTYDSCDLGVTHNQSMDDGTSWLPGQRLTSCSCPGADHPSPGKGRGAPEIDVFEGTADPNIHVPVITQSYQIAPFDAWYYPNYDFMSIPNIEHNFTVLNGYTGGPFQQTLSVSTTLNNAWYDGNQYQTYAFEYIPGTDNGSITWFVGDAVTATIHGKAIGPNGNINSRLISEEPMSIVLNLGISNAWTWIDWEHLKFPTIMSIDYVRWYQKAGHESVTCDPPGWETTQYIADHPLAYQHPNLTSWDETGYGWPANTLTHNCHAQ